MIIDFHTHIFPKAVAQKAIPKLAATINLTPRSDGTLHGLVQSMEQNHVDLSVVMPPMTNPSQFDTMNSYAQKINEASELVSGPKVLSFAGIHPDTKDYKSDLNQISQMGFKGIKLHPDYQHTFFDDIRYKRILYRAAELNLITMTHTGYDPYSPIIHCTPQHILNVINDVHPQKLILAHMGSNDHYDESEQYLIGQNVYIDTAYSLAHMDLKQAVRMIRNHGADRVLFATDSPWAGQDEESNLISSLPLTNEEKEMILHKNAESLLEL